MYKNRDVIEINCFNPYNSKSLSPSISFFPRLISFSPSFFSSSKFRLHFNSLRLSQFLAYLSWTNCYFYLAWKRCSECGWTSTSDLSCVRFKATRTVTIQYFFENHSLQIPYSRFPCYFGKFSWNLLSHQTFSCIYFLWCSIFWSDFWWKCWSMSNCSVIKQGGRAESSRIVRWLEVLSDWENQELTCHVHVAPETNMFGPDRSVAFFNHSTYLKASFSAYFNPLIFGWFSPHFLSCPPH